MANSGDIIPGKSIGKFYLGMNKKELIQCLELDGNCIFDELETSTMIMCGPYSFWVDKQSCGVEQITVGTGFDGTFMGVIKIGSTISDLRRVAGDVIEDLDVYMLKSVPGISFEFVDEDDFDEENIPIEFISVFGEALWVGPS